MTQDDTQSSVHLGRALRIHRRARGWSIQEAAVRAGISPNTLSNVERASMPNPTLSTMLALMELFELENIDSLFGSSPSKRLLGEWASRGRPGIRP